MSVQYVDKSEVTNHQTAGAVVLALELKKGRQRRSKLATGELYFMAFLSTSDVVSDIAIIGRYYS